MAVQAKKKKWYNLIAPKFFNNQMLGQATAYEPNKIIGKKFSINLMSITGDPKNQNIAIKFIVDSVRESNASTYVVGYEISPAGLRRHMKRSASRVDDSFFLKTKDDKTVRIKTFILARGKTKKSIQKNIRKESKKNLTEILSKKTFEQFIQDIIRNITQKQLKNILKSIYPIKIYEIRFAEIKEKPREMPQKKKEAKKEEKEKAKKEKKAEVKENVKAEEKPKSEEKKVEVKAEAKEETGKDVKASN